MSRSIRDATALREVSERIMRDPGNIAWTISETWVRGADNVLRQTWGGSSGGGVSTLEASAAPNSVSGAQSRNGTRPVPTNTTTVTATGGVSPYTYAWAAQPGWSINNPSSFQTAFVAQAVEPGEDVFASFICTVTDAAGATVQVQVDAQASNYGTAGGGVIP